jgi:hypothetical protein
MVRDYTLKISKDFTTFPGARYKNQGTFSGEEFRDDLLIPAFNKAKAAGQKLTIDLDGTAGYAAIFLEEVFGGMVRQLRVKKLFNQLNIISKNEPYLIDDIKNYMQNAENALEL